ncbi:FAD binding domain-containing protein [Amylocystis lapponica]|nr:FAD binding domain-containing protein [Amylocystis lapponica]
MPVSLTKESDVDVLIIGAGPAGVMCANALANARVNVRIVDQRPGRMAAGQADGIQPRTIEVLQSYGLAERLLREANQMHTAAFYNPRADGGGIECTGHAPDVNAKTARYPFECTLHQGAIEAIFLDSMHSLGVDVERPVTPVSIKLSESEEELKDPQSHPVRIVLRHLEPVQGQSDTEIVHAKFVLGADGAHSWVRKNFGIAMEGEQTDYIWGVIDMIPETNFPDIRNRCAIHSDNGSCMIIPREGDKVRLYIQLTNRDVVDPATGRIDKNKMSSPHQLLEVARKSFHPYTMSTPPEIDWWTLYIIGQRVSASFSVHERVFIAGDACHTHSPKAGQGMNASMNDSHNLAWKLAYVLRGWADISILKTYEFERRKYARDLIDFDREFSALFSGKPRTKNNSDGVSHEQFLEAFQTFGAFTSGIGVHYASSAIVNTTHQSHASNLIIGERFLPHVFVRVADGRPYNVQDLLPSDARYKIVALRINALADALDKPESFLHRFARGAPSTVFDILAISSAKRADARCTDFPVLFRAHFSKMFVDDLDMYGRSGGGGYDYYGIDPRGAVVVVRPDGYVGMVAPLDRVQDITDYFESFLVSLK